MFKLNHQSIATLEERPGMSTHDAPGACVSAFQE